MVNLLYFSVDRFAVACKLRSGILYSRALQHFNAQYTNEYCQLSDRGHCTTTGNVFLRDPEKSKSNYQTETVRVDTDKCDISDTEGQRSMAYTRQRSSAFSRQGTNYEQFDWDS